MWIEFFKNIKYVCFIFGYMVYGYVDVGNFVLLYLNEDDVVSLKVYLFYFIIIYGIGYVYMIFMGVLLNFDEIGIVFLRK